MYVKQMYTGCLAEAAYYIESNGEAAIIDPLREVDPYIEMAKERGAKIKYVFETHFHADFVSGHVDLADKTGATIVYGPTTMETGFDAYIAKDNEEFKIGDLTLRLLHTPGHTMESSCYLLIDKDGKKRGLFTGDTLFIGDVGRPDLAQKVIEELTEEKLAAHLYDSLRNKIMPLDDDIIVYPGHGQGSACGKMMSSDTTDTLGHQKRTNYALKPDMTKAEFIEELLTGLTPPPGYFPQNVLMNIKGYEHLDEVIEEGTTPLPPQQFRTLAEQDDVAIIDTRDPEVFEKAFVPGSWNVGLDGDFAPWVGTLLKDVNQKIVFVSEEGKEEEAVTRFARVGFDNVKGYLEGGIKAWEKAGFDTEEIKSMKPAEMKKKMKSENDWKVLDVRRNSEYDSEHVVDAQNTPLDYIEKNLSEVDPDKKYFVHCKGGYRSMIFSSILKSKGYDNFINVDGGFDALKESELFETTDYVSPKTML
ncbi:MAG: MBL fold metallo-hydrolase [Saprospiraceae bacterium]|nr:MBL fold metallo-hydrolase [Saprospiraceae bacterium]